MQQLEDDEHYDISLVDGRCTLEMFGPRKSDAGQYLCIGVNELGQCSQSFQLSVKGEFRGVGCIVLLSIAGISER